MNNMARSSLIAAALFFSVRLLGAADADTNTPTVSATPPPEILTPKSAPTPRINGPKIFGVRPGSPFLYTIPATGERPMTFTAKKLPHGLKLDDKTGRITGVLKKVGEYNVT